MSRAFHIGDILSITTGALVSPRHIVGVHDLLGFMTGDTLFTHQLPRAARECEPSLRAQFPDLAQIVAPEVWPEGDVETVVFGWLAEQVARYGETREVSPLAPEAHTHIDPFTELAMRGVPVLGVIVPDGEPL
jgi:hypothetical protein